jgi:hypothetical protein
VRCWWGAGSAVALKKVLSIVHVKFGLQELDFFVLIIMVKAFSIFFFIFFYKKICDEIFSYFAT